MNTEEQNNNWNSLNKDEQIKIQKRYNRLFDSKNEDELLVSYEIEEQFGEHNLRLRKLFTILYDRCYAGGMALIAARNIFEATKIIEKEYGSWDRGTIKEVENATIYTSFSHVIREGSYAE